MLTLAPHRFKIVLVEPEIPQNTGNIARLCSVTGTELHLVRPLGFILGGRHMKRAGMDYLENVKLYVHDNLDAFRQTLGIQPYWLLTSKAEHSVWDVSLPQAEWIILGRETAGLPQSWVQEAKDRCIRIPMQENSRCLNLANSASIVLYESLRQSHLKKQLNGL